MSRYDQIDWDDIGEFAVMGYLAAGVILPILFYEKMEEVAKKTPDNPRTAWRTRPAIAAARQFDKIWQYMEEREGIGLLCAIGGGLIGLGAGITAICFAGPWLGATWGGLLTLKGLGLGLGALGVGAAVAPVVAAVTSMTAILFAPCAVMLARGWADIKAEFLAGRAETKEWKRSCQEARNALPPPHPLVMAAREKETEMTAQGKHEREQLFRRLQAKFPEEFAEAVRRTDTDTVLRNKVQVMKPVKFNMQPKKKTLAEKLRGAA